MSLNDLSIAITLSLTKIQREVLRAAEVDDADRFESLVKQLDNPDFTCAADGRTLLGKIVSWGSNYCVERLLKFPVDINAKTANGDTPLILAARSGYEEIVKLLIDAGADLRHKNAEGRTALDIARSLYNSEYNHQILPMLERALLGGLQRPSGDQDGLSL